MHSENPSRPSRLRMALVFSAILGALLIAACGSSGGGDPSSSGNATTLLRQTFSGGHSVKSGVLAFDLSIDPSGSSTLTTPIVLSLSGPFQSRGSGKLPESDFTVAISALGKHGALGVVSTGTSGYVTLQGTAYQLPQADFQRLESSFSSVGTGSGSGLGGLGIDPQHWLQSPKVVGSATVGGAQTTQIQAGVNVTALLGDLNTFLAKTAKTSGSSKIPTAIPAATQEKIAAAIRDARVDVWTGASDHTLRRLTLSLDVPVSGETSTELGGVTSAAMGLTLQYSDLNQTQTISAPSKVAPYSQFAGKLRSALGGVEGSVGSSSGTSSGGTSSGASSADVDKYSLCIQQAGQDVAKMQKCASLLKK